MTLSLPTIVLHCVVFYLIKLFTVIHGTVVHFLHFLPFIGLVDLLP